MLPNKKIWIRRETFNNEARSPLVPADVGILIKLGFTVVVESCTTRCYQDEQFEKYGAVLTKDAWYVANDFLVIGIKELNYLEKLNHHSHLYFSHSFKNQKNSEIILKTFRKSNSLLFDLEYFLENNQRMIAFGFWAGVVGAVLGLAQFYLKLSGQKLNSLKHFDSLDKLFEILPRDRNIKPKICLIGPGGRTGQGVLHVLTKLGFESIVLSRFYSKDNLQNFDILYNCILLKENIGVWFDRNTVFSKNMVITDISCDYTHPFNPIPLYTCSTTWEKPVYKYNEFVDIIAIENLPSLLPKESSNDFSSTLVKILATLPADENNYWKNNLTFYVEAAGKIIF
jgi:saccharopine dehydrogenase (NAD+, L-lysine-forming)